MPVSARRHHLAPRLKVTLSGYQPAPFACRPLVGCYPTLSAHTRPVLGLTRACPLDTFTQAPPRATCILAVATPRIPKWDITQMARYGDSTVFLYRAPTISYCQTIRSGNRRDRTAHGPVAGPARLQALPERNWVSCLATRAKTRLPAPAGARALRRYP